MALKLVVHYRDGRLVKGATVNFNPASASFSLSMETAVGGEASRIVCLRDLKAIFFVKSFFGNSDYTPRKQFQKGDAFQGQRLRITFQDGEVMIGSSPNYSPANEGFFFFPVDSQGNTIKAWVPNASVREATMLTA
jgi:hypothetical protein